MAPFPFRRFARLSIIFSVLVVRALGCRNRRSRFICARRHMKCISAHFLKIGMPLLLAMVCNRIHIHKRYAMRLALLLGIHLSWLIKVDSVLLRNEQTFLTHWFELHKSDLSLNIDTFTGSRRKLARDSSIPKLLYFGKLWTQCSVSIVIPRCPTC